MEEIKNHGVSPRNGESISYVLTKSPFEGEKSGEVTIYGVRVIRRRDGFEDEIAAVKDITSIQEKGEEFLSLIIRNTALPDELLYLAEDFVI